MWLRFDWVTRYILTSFKNGIVKKKLETYKSLVDQRWSLDISSMRTFVFYSNTSLYSHMLLFYFLLLGVSPDPFAQPKSIIWSIKNQFKCSKWQNKKLQRTDATGQRNKLLNTKTVSGSSELSSACNMLYTCIIFLFEDFSSSRWLDRANIIFIGYISEPWIVWQL